MSLDAGQGWGETEEKSNAGGSLLIRKKLSLFLRMKVALFWKVPIHQPLRFN